MGNCGAKPKTSDGDDAPPPPVEPQTAAGAAAEGERKDEEAPAPEGTSLQAVVPPQSEVRKMISAPARLLSITRTESFVDNSSSSIAIFFFFLRKTTIPI